jgi:hypothetical protein
MINDKKIDSRASQTKVKEQKKVWTPPSSLDAPPAPDGFKHRWIRAETMGFDDTSNMSAKLRSGFELVRSDEYSDIDYPTVNTGKYKGVIGVGGLLLARIPEDRNNAIDNDLMKEQHPSMPINSDRQTRVTFGGTKKS